jgi:MFS family permease
MLSGLVMVVAAPDMTYSLEFATIGFTVTGLGLSTLMPIAFSSAGHLKDGIDGSIALTIIAGFSYAGSIVNAPVIGLVSDLSGSLRYGIVCDLLVLSCLVPLSMVLPAETSRFLSNSSSSKT